MSDWQLGSSCRWQPTVAEKHATSSASEATSRTMAVRSSTMIPPKLSRVNARRSAGALRRQPTLS